MAGVLAGTAPARALAALLLLALPTAARADRALLIGVGEYPRLAPALRLAAPARDAERLGAALVRAGFAADRIRTLTDGAATRAAVLAALAALAAGAVPGEQLLVYFSGHGAQAPALDPSLEPDGLDELYLMDDAAGWDGGLGRVPGAIGDAELADALDRIRARGADVWFVADTCHGGGLYRAGALPPGAVAKAVNAAALGIPPRPRAVPAPAAPARSSAAPAGSFAGFYAAAPDALAVERRLPLGSPAAAPWSQFSYALVRAIDAGRLRSLRDLAIATIAADDALGPGGGQPLFEGTLGRGVLGLRADRARRFAVRRTADGLVLAAGTEEGVAAGSRWRLRTPDDAAAGEAVADVVTIGAAHLHARAAIPAGTLEAEPVDRAAAAAPGPLALAAALAGGAGVAGLDVTARLWRPGARARCAALDPAGPPAAAALRTIDLLAPPTLGQCDVVLATAANRGAAPLDVSAFYVDAAGRAIALAWLGEDDVRIPPGAARTLAVRLLTRDRAGRRLPAGSERLLLLALPAADATRIDLRGIATRGAGGMAPAGAGALVYRWTVR